MSEGIEEKQKLSDFIRDSAVRIYNVQGTDVQIITQMLAYAQDLNNMEEIEKDCNEMIEGFSTQFKESLNDYNLDLIIPEVLQKRPDSFIDDIGNGNYNKFALDEMVALMKKTYYTTIEQMRKEKEKEKENNKNE